MTAFEPDQLTGELRPWDDVKGMKDWSGLLLGNGASVAIWRKFDYRSLFEVSLGLGDGHALTEADQNLFSVLEANNNFEQVLHDLSVTESVLQALGEVIDSRTGEIEERYEHIRDALIGAVHEVHIDFSDLPESTLDRVMGYVSDFRQVFTLNYDLMLYWSMMRDKNRSSDFFNHGEFEPRFERGLDWTERCHVYFVHGGLHLYATLHGETRKNQRDEGASLLEKFGLPINDERVFPVFVSEGSAQRKRAAIAESPYLTFAYERLQSLSGPLLMFGISLTDMDRHISDAINRNPYRTVAVGIYPKKGEDYAKTMKARYFAFLGQQKLLFFDSTTHPLGASEISVGVQFRAGR